MRLDGHRESSSSELSVIDCRIHVEEIVSITTCTYVAVLGRKEFQKLEQALFILILLLTCIYRSAFKRKIFQTLVKFNKACLHPLRILLFHAKGNVSLYTHEGLHFLE